MNRSENSSFWCDPTRARDALRYRGHYYRRVAEQEEEFVISQLLPGRHRVLEVGPGSGRFTRHLAKIADELIVCDISEHTLQQVERRLAGEANLRTICCSLESLGDLSGFHRCDAAVAMRVAPYVDDLSAALQSLVRSVRPGGLVIFDLWNDHSFEGWWQRLWSPTPIVAPNFLHASGMQRILEALPVDVMADKRWGYPRLGWLSLDLPGALLFPQGAYSTTFCCRRR